MNHSYLRSLRWVPQPQPQPTGVAKSSFSGRLLAAFLLLFCLSFSSFAQTAIFTEDMSDSSPGAAATSRETIANYTGRGGFTYDASGAETGTATYGGSARTATSANSTGYPGSSQGASIFFGGVTDPGTPPYDFIVSGINTSQASSVGLTFGLYTPNGADPGLANFRVEYTTNGTSYTSVVSYSRTTNNVASGTASAWNLYTVSFASQPTPSATFGLRFTRTAAATTQLYRLDDVRVTGNVTTTPTINANPTTLVFGSSTVVGTTSAEQTFTASAVNLTAPLVFTATTGYLISTTSGGPYTSFLSLTPSGGAVPSTTIYTVFRPTVAGANNGSVTLTSTGAASVVVGTFATGQPAPASLSANPATINFANTQVGQASTPTTITISGSNLTSSTVSVTAPDGFQVRLPNGSYSTTLVLPVASGSLNQAIEARFVPTAAIAYNSQIDIAAGSTATSVEVTGTASPAPTGPFIVANPGSLNFGLVSTSGSSQVLTFSLNAGNLTNPLVLTSSSNNILFRDASAGGSFVTGPLTITPTNGTVSIRDIEVQLTRPVGSGPFTGNITITSSGAATQQVAITGNNASGRISDISVTNPNNFDFTFVTRPNTSSAALSYNVSAANLLQPLTITTTGQNAVYFQISTDNVNFSSQLSITPDAQGNVTNRPIYVRFLPGNNAITVTAIIRNASAPADNGDLTVTGISEPTLRLSQAVGNFADNVVKGTLTAPASLQVVGFLLGSDVTIRVPLDNGDLDRNPTQTPQFEFSLNGGATYVKQAAIPIDANGNLTQNLLVRYAPIRVGASSTELEFRNPSFASNAFFSLASGFGRSQGFAIAPVPTAQSTANVALSAARTSATITFNLNNPPAGTSYGQNRLIIASSTYTTLPASLLPQPKQNFSPGSTINGEYQFGTGTAIGSSGTDTYAVFTGSASSFTVGNLDPSKTYYFYSFEFNNDGLLNAENYRVPSNQAVQPLPVELVSFTAQLRGSQVNLNWVTASEKNNRGFEVQRSQDARDFSTILFKQGNGTTSARSTYDAVDARPLPGLSYYRLKQIDNDGKFAYSPVVIVKNAGLTEASLFPNPTSGKLTVALPQAITAEALRVRIMDLTGRVMLETKLPVTGELDLSALPNGTYMVTVGAGQQQVTRKVVKN